MKRERKLREMKNTKMVNKQRENKLINKRVNKQVNKQTNKQNKQTKQQQYIHHRDIFQPDDLNWAKYFGLEGAAQAIPKIRAVRRT